MEGYPSPKHFKLFGNCFYNSHHDSTRAFQNCFKIGRQGADAINDSHKKNFILFRLSSEIKDIRKALDSFDASVAASGSKS